MFKHKSLKGNVCLVVLLAFILTFIPGVPGVVGGDGVASASDPSVGTLDFSGGNVTIPISPITSPSFNSMTLKLSFKDAYGNNLAVFDIAYGAVGVSQVLVVDDTTYGKVYAWVYGTTLYLKYVPANGIVIPTTSAAVYAYVYETTYQSIDLDLRFKPPMPSSGGSSAPTTVITDTGSITVSGGTATVTLDAGKVEKALSDAKGDVIEITPPAQVQAGRHEVNISPSILTLMEEKGKGLAFSIAEDAGITLPPGAINLGEVGNLGANAKVVMVIEKVPPDRAKELLQGVATDQSLVGDVFEFNIKVVVGTGSQAKEHSVTLSKPVLVTAPFDPIKVGTDNQFFLGLYRRNDDGTWSYRKSWVSPGSDEVTAQIHSFSKYAVMLYRKSFADTVSHWARTDVELMASKHVVKGVSDDAFNPDGKVTRAEFAAMVVRALGLSRVPGAAFTDVAADAWYAGSVGAAAKAGIVLGMGDGTFRPNDRITREQVAVMVARALKAAGKSVTADQVEALLGAFTDRGRISGWAHEGVAAAAEYGIVKGRNGGVFAPGDDATRAEAAVMVKRYLGSVSQL